MPMFYVMIVDPGAGSRARRTGRKQPHTVGGEPKEFGFATSAEVKAHLQRQYPAADIYVRPVDQVEPKDAWVVDLEHHQQVNTVTGEVKPLP